MSATLRGRLWGVLFMLCTGCVHGGSNAVGSAVLNTALAAGASAISRASGGCYAACPAGTTCNPETGLCDTLPCRGTCSPYERCEENGLGGRCVPMSQPGSTLTVRPAPPRQVPQEALQDTPPAVAPAAPPPEPARLPADAPRRTVD